MDYSEIKNKDYQHSYSIEVFTTDINGINNIIDIEIFASEVVDLENYKFGLNYDYFINRSHVDSDFEPCEEHDIMEDIFNLLCMNIINASQCGSIYEGVK